MARHKRIVEITLRHDHSTPHTEVIITRKIGHGMNTEYQEETYSTSYARMFDLAEMMKKYVEEHNCEVEIDAGYKSLAVTAKIY